MKLQILIPHYKETPDEMEPLLDSVALQQNVDFGEVGVIVAYDGRDATELPRGEWASKYPFEIRHVVTEEHMGVSAARNAALDAAIADYVMFCDADDMFCNVCGLWILFREMAIGFDSLVSQFIEESRLPETKEPIYINRDMDSTFVHGKVHRRGYLVDNGIRWNDSLTIHEDSYFNILCQNLSENVKYCPTPFYLWKWRDSSVCRHDPDYILKTYNNMLDSNDALVDEFVRRMRNDKACQFVGFMVMDAYYTMNKPEWLDKTHADYRDAVERRFARYYAKHRSQFETLTQQERMQISLGVRQRSVMEGMLMESVTLEQWLDRISDAQAD
ncbi:MAG TPA: hypothetical protein DCP91_09415 [Eggerthellaceae bacterium]|nr:hypothetical protein [Eggerthellaceae bacterium]